MLFTFEPYIWDTSSLSQLFRFYYPQNFPGLWVKFNSLVVDCKFLSTREVQRELGVGNKAADAHQWADENDHFFPDPQDEEIEFVSRILAVPNFRQILRSKKGKPKRLAADPFVIAQANSTGGTVVTEEAKPPNGARIPNICEHFDIDCINLQQLMDREGWIF